MAIFQIQCINQRRLNLRPARNSALFAHTKWGDSGIRLHRRCPVRSSAAVEKARCQVEGAGVWGTVQSTGMQQHPAEGVGLRGATPCVGMREHPADRRGFPASGGAPCPARGGFSLPPKARPRGTAPLRGDAAASRLEACPGALHAVKRGEAPAHGALAHPLPPRQSLGASLAIRYRSRRVAFGRVLGASPG